VSFEVPPEERAEAYTVGFYDSGATPRVSHDLPEGRPGETLSEAQARGLAVEVVESQLEFSAETVREISADEAVRPDRTDWVFTFAATEGYPLGEGEGRLVVGIAGDEVVGAGRFVHIPEEWERDWQANESLRQLPSLVMVAFVLFLALGAAILAVVRWARGSLVTRPLRVLSVPLAVILLISGINEWPNAVGIFTTQASFWNQAVMVILGIGLGSIVLAISLGLLASLGHTWIQASPQRVMAAGTVGLAVGLALIGGSEALSGLGSSGPPGWPDYGGAVTYLPWASVALGGLVQYLALASIALLLMGSLESLQGTKWSWAAIPLVLVVGLAISSNPPGAGWFSWIGGAVSVAAAIGVLWGLCRRLGWAILPGAASAPVFLDLAETILRNPFPGSILGATLGIAGVVVVMNRWARAV
jgi:hypothetical protein